MLNKIQANIKIITELKHLAEKELTAYEAALSKLGLSTPIWGPYIETNQIGTHTCKSGKCLAVFKSIQFGWARCGFNYRLVAREQARTTVAPVRLLADNVVAVINTATIVKIKAMRLLPQLTEAIEADVARTLQAVTDE
jgi:hypothetical protein